MSLSITKEFTLTEQRCHVCGVFWAVESGSNFARNRCPVCAQIRVDEAESELSAALKSVNAMKGVITKLRKTRLKKV